MGVRAMNRLITVWSALIVVLCAWGAANREARADEPAKTHVVLVTGDDEYRSEITLPMIAKILETHHNMRCTVLYAVDDKTGERDPKYHSNIPGLEALKTADVAVFFVRFRTLPDAQFQMVRDYVESGKPAVGLRTTTHAFLYPDDHPLKQWNDEFGIRVFGQKWITHHGHTSRTDVSVIPDMKDHPILRGVESTFPAASWLYHVEPLAGDCQPLLFGQSVKSEKSDMDQKKYPPKQPVAWTKTDRPGKVFFTTLGHPKDFEQTSMRRLLINGICWTLEREIPPGGTNADVVGEYVAPPTH